MCICILSLKKYLSYNILKKTFTLICCNAPIPYTTSALSIKTWLLGTRLEEIWRLLFSIQTRFVICLFCCECSCSIYTTIELNPFSSNYSKLNTIANLLKFKDTVGILLKLTARFWPKFIAKKLILNKWIRCAFHSRCLQFPPSNVQNYFGSWTPAIWSTVVFCANNDFTRIPTVSGTFNDVFS